MVRDRFEEERDGVKRKPGAGDNPRIVQYLKSTDLGKPANRNDETAWCSAFVNWCVEQSDHDGTNSAAARSWMHWGKGTKRPTKGAIVVLWRGSKTGTQGHVGFYVRSVNSRIELLGGNQGDRVSLQQFPKNRLLGYRTL